jgi:hypothetical protein
MLVRCSSTVVRLVTKPSHPDLLHITTSGSTSKGCEYQMAAVTGPVAPDAGVLQECVLQQEWQHSYPTGAASPQELGLRYHCAFAFDCV